MPASTSWGSLHGGTGWGIAAHPNCTPHHLFPATFPPPYSRQKVPGVPKGFRSQPKVNPKPTQSQPKANPKPTQSQPKANPKPVTQSQPKASPDLAQSQSKGNPKSTQSQSIDNHPWCWNPPVK
uniref:Uncharacterized protein n=1 Tax=Amazona collaria TaxID=241587 RepID=A0A8B9IS64_9PSIT